MFYFDKADDRVLFGDIRSESHVLCDGRALDINPDQIVDFRNLPHADETFRVVVFDPPHLVRVGRKSWTFAKYGGLGPDWQDDLRGAFAECFRVLRPGGVLIFKWNEIQIPASKITALAEHRPLVGHRSGKRSNTHWITFLKPERAA